MSTETKVAAHTPGPWYTSPQQGYVRYEGVHGPNICGMDEFGGPAEEAFANARLIAAAPEMLQALKDIAETLDKMSPCPEEILDALLATAQSAIRTAERGGIEGGEKG